MRTPLSDAQLGWAAGIIDGEGCIHIGKVRMKDRVRPRWRFMVRVANTDPRMVYRLKELFGGSVQGPRLLRLSTKPAYEWVLVGNAVLPFLQAIRPHLVVKGQQADLAVEFAATMRPHHQGPVPLAEGVVAERQRIVDQLQVLRREVG